MKLTRTHFLLGLAGAARLAAQDRPNMLRYERQPFTVPDFQAEGHILDIGGGGEGIIGRMKPRQVVAIDLYKEELLQAPPGPLKIVMDATEMHFLDGQFNTATAFFSLMYMKPEVQRKVFAETFRVLKSGGRWLVWDACIPTAPNQNTKGPIYYFEFHLPAETVNTGYGTFWPAQAMDLAYYRSLASSSGFQVISAREQDGHFRTFHMELRKS
ncbi:class I SAM-dependent methyltransferase [uncultured Paludibaculum sp.]|uniref:class I SAM-dependent methyltransferase n=1 Tax=uncultured Paludibaculum sp. TaxID=1765020 RepID=UPI002AAC1614|nr:class I SAM-dependent methyltransferase [uncultured Paludibaculum sp.]